MALKINCLQVRFTNSPNIHVPNSEGIVIIDDTEL